MRLLPYHDQGILQQSGLVFNGRRRAHSVGHVGASTLDSSRLLADGRERLWHVTNRYWMSLAMRGLLPRFMVHAYGSNREEACIRRGGGVAVSEGF